MSEKETTARLRQLFPRKVMSATELKSRYPWMVRGSIQGEGEARTAEIACQHPGCKKHRRTRTMDLFQVRYCVKHQQERDTKLTTHRRNRWRKRDKARRKAVREEQP